MSIRYSAVGDLHKSNRLFRSFLINMNISTTYLTQNMQHFHRTQSIFSKFSETFPLPHPDQICWPPQLRQNRLSPRRSTSTTLQLRASLHIFLQRIWHKICNISIELRVCFPNLVRHFPYHTQIKYAGPLNLDKIAYLSVAQPVVVVRSKAINHLHLAVVLMSTVGLSSLFSFILRTHMVLWRQR